jgi:hypothetical protein
VTTIHPPERVLPDAVARAVSDLPGWFVIGGQAVRCLCPYRPSVDADFGVALPRDLDGLLEQLRRRGTVEMLERTPRVAHLRFDGIDVSVFVLEELAAFTEERRLDKTGVLAHKLHAIVDRGTRRDFFDVYVTLQVHRAGIAECLAAMRQVYPSAMNEALLLRALTWFDDAEREARIPGEGDGDWDVVKEFFLTRVGQLLVPPLQPLAVQARVVDVRGPAAAAPRAKRRSRRAAHK